MIHPPNVAPEERLRWLYLYRTALSAGHIPNRTTKLLEIEDVIAEHMELLAAEKSTNVRFMLLRRPRMNNRVRPLYTYGENFD